MSASGTDEITVKDDEEYVPKRVKQRILDSRERVNEREDELFTARLLDPEVGISEAQATVAWGSTVKQFMRDIEVLLDRLPVESAEQYYRNVDLGQMVLLPPDKGGYAFSRVAHVDDADALRRELGLPKQATVPQPKAVTFTGLLSVIEREPIQQENWSVCVEAKGPPSTHEYLQLRAAEPVPKWIYENAIRAADRFLQDAGIGVEIDAGDHMSEEPGL